jgi:hypothetical protein
MKFNKLCGYNGNAQQHLQNVSLPFGGGSFFYVEIGIIYFWKKKILLIDREGVQRMPTIISIAEAVPPFALKQDRS